MKGYKILNRYLFKIAMKYLFNKTLRSLLLSFLFSGEPGLLEIGFRCCTRQPQDCVDIEPSTTIGIVGLSLHNAGNVNEYRVTACDLGCYVPSFRP